MSRRKGHQGSAAMRVIKKGIMVSGAVVRALIGIGATAGLLFAAFRKRKKSI